MRQINIDLTTDKHPLSLGSFIGYIGEHNATELLITIPQAMIDKSDYQILVFQATPLMFRSSRITEDNTKNSYRVGNVIHTKLSKTITQVPSLSLQVECYKEDGCGEPELIGKTQTFPNLILKPSPEGFPVYGYEGSYEDLDFAIFNAHKHTNLDTLNRFGTNAAGVLTFDGDAIVNLVKHYSNPSEFPETSLVGTLAYAENDDPVLVSEDTIVEPFKVYSRIRIRHDIDPQVFNLIYRFADRTSQDIQYGLAAISYGIACEDEVMLGGISIMCSQETLSLMMVTPKPFYYTKALYGKDERLRNLDSGSYLFSSIEIPNLSNETIPKGWSFAAARDGNFKFEHNDYNSEEITKFYEIKKDDSLFSVYKNSGLIRETNVLDKKLESEFLSAIFEIVPEPIKTKGLYIFTDTGWLPFEDYLRSNTRIVNTFADLPEDCPTGTLAHVINDGYQITPLTYKQTITNGYIYPGVYFTPYPVEESFLFDFSFHGVYVDNNRVPYKGFIDVQSNLDEKYILVTRSISYDSTAYDTFLYSLEDQEFVENDKTYLVKKGWNKVIPLSSEEVHIKAITDFSDLPYAKRGLNHDSSYGYLITDITINGNTTNNLQHYLFSTNSRFTTIDNGKGLWVKTENEWMKVENADEFLMQEVNI